MWRLQMAWQQFSSGVWFNHLAPTAPNWWIGWNNVGGFQLFNQLEPPTAQQIDTIQVQRHHHSDGWVDFYLGQALSYPSSRCSLLDAGQKIAIHYLRGDLAVLKDSMCPSCEIPARLWTILQTQADR